MADYKSACTACWSLNLLSCDSQHHECYQICGGQIVEERVLPIVRTPSRGNV